MSSGTQQMRLIVMEFGRFTIYSKKVAMRNFSLQFIMHEEAVPRRERQENSFQPSKLNRAPRTARTGQHRPSGTSYRKE